MNESYSSVHILSMDENLKHFYSFPCTYAIDVYMQVGTLLYLLPPESNIYFYYNCLMVFLAQVLCLVVKLHFSLLRFVHPGADTK